MNLLQGAQVDEFIPRWSAHDGGRLRRGEATVSQVTSGDEVVKLSL